MPSSLVVLLGVGFVVLAIPVIRSFLTYGLRSKTFEARVCLKGIGMAELEYFKQHGRLVSAGPVPASIPFVQKQPFGTDEGFTSLGWRPEGSVYHQYEVRLTGPKSALLIAKGDIDGNGRVAEYRLELVVDAPLGQVQSLTPDEY